MRKSERTAKRKWVEVALAGMAVPFCLLVVVGFAWYKVNFTPTHNPEYEGLMKAIDRRDLTTVKLLLKQGVNPNFFPNTDADHNTYNDNSPLADAAFSDRNYDIVKELLDHGAAPNMYDRQGDYPLGAASEGTSLKVMELLIQWGARVNDRDGNSFALYDCVTNCKLVSASFLLAHGANPNTNVGLPKERLIDYLRRYKPQRWQEAVRLLKKAGAKG